MAAPNLKLRSLALLLPGILSLSCQASGRLQLDNALDACLGITETTIESHQNLLLLRTAWESKDNVGACGCKSAAIAYSVYLGNEQRLVSHGMLSSIGKSGAALVLSSDNTIYRDVDYRLEISCAN